MKDAELRFSVVIPCYNEAQFIGRTLTSLRQQQFPGKYEVIVVDNNCTDETVAIAKSYGVRVVREQQPGVCWARQAGTKAARGEIVVSTDADTVQAKEWLANIDASFRRHKDCVAVAGPCAYEDGPWWGKRYPALLFGMVAIAYRLIGRPFYVTATNLAFKKSAWTRYRTSLTQGGDELALLHDLRRKGKVVFDNTNPVYTSGRRLTKGLVYNIFVTLFGYYLIGYYINKLSGRTIIGMAPAYRVLGTSRNRRVFAYRSVLTAFLLVVFHLPGHDTVLQQTYETFAAIKRDL